jgi:hypothetical protein
MAYNERFHRDLRKELEDRRARGKEDDFWTGLKGAIESNQISPHEFSIRGLFENFVETRSSGQRVGPELVNSFNPSRGVGRTLLEEAGNAISTANFANITGQIVYSTLLDRYKDRSFIGDKLVTTVPTEFNGEKIPGINRIGDEAESIGEGKAYPTASFSESWIQTPQTTKRGMIVQVTLETVFFDRTGLVLENAGEVGYWMGVNKEKRILDHVLGVTNSYNFLGTAYNTYQSSSPWINVQATNQLIDFVSINTALLLFDKMTDPFTGEPIAVMADTMVVPSALHPTAMALQRATEVWAAPGLTSDTPGTAGSTWSTHAPNPARYPSPFGGKVPVSQFEVLSSPLIFARNSSATSWFIGDFQRAFMYMENWPIQVIQAPPGNEAEFTEDVVARFKVTERGTVAVKDPRYVAKCTA